MHDSSATAVTLTVVAGLILLGIVVWLTWPDSDADPATCPPPPLTAPADPKNDACILTNREMHASFQFNEQWQLPSGGEGAFVFDVCAPRGGLVVYLTDNPNNETLSDTKGYAIVLGDQAARPRSYIGKLPHFVLASDARTAMGRVNYDFALNDDPQACTSYWVICSGGEVQFGVGDAAGKNTLICCMKDDPFPVEGLRYFGFGCLRREDVGIRVRNIRTYDAPVGGCKWLSMSEHSCAELTDEYKSLTSESATASNAPANASQAKV